MPMVKLQLLGFLLISCLTISGQSLFPGAEGYGAFGRGAYGGDRLPQLVVVSNLNDTGPGSLRAALNKDFPRIIVFEVAGVIELKRRIRVLSPYVMVAGQTAPYPGITIKNWSLSLGTHDVLIQCVKVRTGLESGRQIDGINIADNPQKVYNVMIDHCSVSWGLDENIGVLKGGKGICISHCIIAEALDYFDHSCGLLAMDTEEISIIKNLFIHNSDRNPLVRGDTKKAIVVNNLVYNCDSHAIYFGTPGQQRKGMQIAALNNFYEPGAENRNQYIISISPEIVLQSKIFLDGNMTGHYFAGKPSHRVLVHNPGKRTVITNKVPLKYPEFNLIEVQEIEKYLLKNCGAFPNQRDPIDNRLIAEMINRKGKRIVNPQEVGGWDMTTNNHVLDFPVNLHADDDEDGFTNLEEWLNALINKGCDSVNSFSF
ncbi:pectate lyase [Marinilabiliaceae bacterium JC017]|nr:pectate lyase [Marinilabiliaceae bacterium JC017]